MRRTPRFVLDGMTIPVHSSFFAKRHKRPVWISRRQYRLIAKVQAGWKGDQRSLAKATGYTIGGLNDALQALRATGVLAMATRPGRYGFTRLGIVKGVHVTNVRVQVATPLKDSLLDDVTTYANISDHALSAAASIASSTACPP